MTPQATQARSPSISDPLDPVLIVEAALFSAGKPVTVEEIAENTGLARTSVPKAIAELARRYAAASTSLEVSKAGDNKWAMQVQTRYTPATVRMAPMEVPIKLLKTLALVAFHQPILQSDLKDLVGDKVYDHIRELKELGLVKKRATERSFQLVTSDRFPDYFGIPASDREGIKTFLAEKVGLELPKTDDKGNRKLSTFPAPGASDAPPAQAPQPAAEAGSDEAPATESSLDAATTAPPDEAQEKTA